MYKQVEIVGSYNNGTEALEAIKKLKPDLAIIDIKMPGQSGLEILTEIRKEDKLLKFIILTFYSSDHYRKLAIQGGADYFYNKVDDFDQLPMVIAGLVLKEANKNKTVNI